MIKKPAAVLPEEQGPLHLLKQSLLAERMHAGRPHVYVVYLSSRI